MFRIRGFQRCAQSVRPRIMGLRRVSQYNYHQPYQPPRSKWRTFFVVVGGLGVGLYGAYYLWWPKHTFPTLVAKILRKGLWAESDRGENDYQLALKHYLEALEECKKTGVDRSSDEYTGVQLKIAEMFERLNMAEEAAMVYNEIGVLYLTLLTDKSRRLNSIERRHFIQKDLRIAIKLAQINQNHPHLVKAILITHLIIAQDEIKRKLGNHSINDVFTSVTDNAIAGEVKIDNATLGKYPEVWEPFAEEYFNAMDLLSATCLVTGDLALATQIKIGTIQGMLLASIDPLKLLLSQCNLGSLLYFQAEQFESKEFVLKKKYPNLTVKDTTAKDKAAIVSEILWDEKMSADERAEFTDAVAGKHQSIKSSIEAYESVLEFAKAVNTSTPKDDAQQQRALSEIIALATYGLGVIHLHIADYDKSERMLRESRVRAKSSGYDELISEIERELGKLFKEKKHLSDGGSLLEPTPKEQIELDIHVKG